MQLNELIERLKDHQGSCDLIVEVNVNGKGYEIVEVVEEPDFDDEYVKLKTRKAR